jgi:glucose-1-phosphate cytidylyltransferase
VLSQIAGHDGSMEYEGLATEARFVAYQHEGSWQFMDTLRDTRLLRSLWESDDAPWQTW